MDMHSRMLMRMAAAVQRLEPAAWMNDVAPYLVLRQSLMIGSATRT